MDLWPCIATVMKLLENRWQKLYMLACICIRGVKSVITKMLREVNDVLHFAIEAVLTTLLIMLLLDL